VPAGCRPEDGGRGLQFREGPGEHLAHFLPDPGPFILWQIRPAADSGG
jgi:hypothetical protein